MRRLWRVGATLVVTGLCTAYILWKIDIGKTWHVLTHARAWWFVAALAIMVVSVWPMAWRWQRLLAARGVNESLPRLVRTYFVGYAAGQ
ncbi:MAG TPA: lysylphosphatidylglycerol synthase domain-containing protein, partial [Gaiellaceae bacterium]|nr:lysylphosphatidylglycerol synthase domain-containing protein [Gaiellaceae bacterium]